MSQRIVQFVEYWSNKSKLFFALFILFSSVLIYGTLQLKVDQSIYSILPKGEIFEGFNKVLSSKNISNKVFFSIQVDENSDEDDLLNLTQEVNDSLSENCSAYFSNIVNVKDNLELDIYDYYYSNLPILIDSNYYGYIQGKLITDSINSSINTSYRSLLAPSGGFMKQFVLNDPLFISSQFFKSLENDHSNEQMTVENGLLFSKERDYVYIYANLNDISSVDKEELYVLLERYKENWNEVHGDNQLDYFGSFQIAVENSLQVKKDSFLTLTITIVGILMILFLYYRKISIPLFFVLPTVFGGLFALGMVGFISPVVSGLSLATGAILFGIILDYSFHFFTHLEHTKSIEQTIKEISAPLLTGGVTTILAFAILMFANSVILQDFGLFASLALLGASLFTLFVLPIILTIFSFEFRTKKVKTKKGFTIPPLSKKFYPLAILLILGVTIFMFKMSSGVEFDDDLGHLSYHKESLKTKEDKFVGINPDIQKKIYLFSKGISNENTFEINYNLIQELKALKGSGKVDNFYSTGDFIIPLKIKTERSNRWNKFWNANPNGVYDKMDSLGADLGFSEAAFGKFKNWTSDANSGMESIDTALLSQLELNSLLDYDEEGKLTILSTLVIRNENIAFVKSRLQTIDGVVIFDRKDMATSLVKLVKDDFNYLLYASAFIVFFTLLLVYGRIELTLIAFIPMVISWIWILGFAALFEIKFNFINVVITTFIFGLGDDFSIFVTDGLIQKYKYKKDSLKSYKSAIVLSALTTIIGTGVLYFAKHPAIHSIAVLSVLGIICILFVSLVVQPILFNFFIQRRVDSKKPPHTFLVFIYSNILLFVFAIGSVLSTLLSLSLLVIALPIKKRIKKSIITYLLSKLCLILIYLGFHFRKKNINKENLDFSKPSIIIANHSSWLDILVMIMQNPKVVLVVKKWVYKSPIFGWVVRYTDYIYVNDGAEENLEKVRRLVKEGYSIVVFPEGARSENGNLKRFHKGAFYMAHELKLDITPVIIHGASDISPKTDFIIGKGHLTLKFLPRIKFDDLSWGDDYKSRTNSISKFYKAEFYKTKNELENAKYFKQDIFNNYLYKGPLLEWYFKIKWRFEAENYDFYNQLIGDRIKIMDVGCGYGYFTYFVHYKNKDRVVLGLDYDSEKIEIAKNAYNITENVTFESTDITTFDIPERDVIFYNDVLHYLSEKEQLEVLIKSIKALSKNGLLIIRDGITDLENRHKTTLKTEKYSTHFVGFNKKTRDFNFFSIEFIKNFAVEHDLDFEFKEQSKKTSNVLFILTKR
jgi:1-acyl-sn-glycerol-3-phosphate acyltransferase